jgi:hypothetical protein
LLDEVDNESENDLWLYNFPQLPQFVDELAVNIEEVVLVLVNAVENFLEMSLGYFPQVVKYLGVVAIFLFLFFLEVRSLLEFTFFIVFALILIENLVVRIKLLQITRVYLF